MKMLRQKRDPQMVKESNDSRLSADFAKLAKPAKRALLNATIRSARDLARQTADRITRLHGIGPSAMPLLRAVLKKRGLKFRPSAQRR